MKTIYFKNKETKEVSQEIAEIIKKKLTEKCENFQIFSDKGGELFLIINLTEVVYIA